MKLLGVLTGRIGAPMLLVLTLDACDRGSRTNGDEPRTRRDRLTSASPEQGKNLATTLERCLRDANAPVTAEALMTGAECGALRRVWAGAGPDDMARQGDQAGDDGWRWELAPGGEPRAIVFPDPVLSQAGPIFEARPRRILQRTNRESPAFHADRFLSDVEQGRACVAQRAAALRAAGHWDGFAETLPVLLARPDAGPPGCPRVEIELQRNPEPGVIRLKMSGAHVSSSYAIDHRGVDGGYEWAFHHQGRAFLIDRSGRWHARYGAAATIKDPPPDACELDRSVPCDQGIRVASR